MSTKIKRRHIESALSALGEVDASIRLLYLDEHGRSLGRDVTRHAGATALKLLHRAQRQLGDRRAK